MSLFQVTLHVRSACCKYRNMFVQEIENVSLEFFYYDFKTIRTVRLNRCCFADTFNLIITTVYSTKLPTYLSFFWFIILSMK